jgi:hypothetical protein
MFLQQTATDNRGRDSPATERRSLIYFQRRSEPNQFLSLAFGLDGLESVSIFTAKTPPWSPPPSGTLPPAVAWTKAISIAQK